MKEECIACGYSYFTDMCTKKRNRQRGKKMKGKEYPKPTLAQSIASWHIVNDLVELGYPHNFQRESPHIRNYMYKISEIIESAYLVKEGAERKEE